MEEIESIDEQPKRWGRRLGLAFVALLVLLLFVYFIVTSGPFIKAVILPKASASLNAKITAEDVSLSPFSKLHLKKVSVLTTGAEPLFAADEMTIRYSLLKILKGNIHVDECTVERPVIQVIKEVDGSS